MLAERSEYQQASLARGFEMADHKRFTLATDIQVYSSMLRRSTESTTQSGYSKAPVGWHSARPMPNSISGKQHH